MAGEGFAERVIVMAVSDGPAFTLTGPHILIADLTVRTHGQSAFDVKGGNSSLENLSIEGELAGAYEDYSAYAVLSIGETSEATLRRCRITGYRWGVYARGAGRATVEDCRLVGDWTPESICPTLQRD